MRRAPRRTASGKPKKRVSKAPYPVALPCVLVAVDPGLTSGWATYVEGRPVTWGEVDAADTDRIEAILLAACELAVKLSLPIVLLGEDWGTVRGGFGGGGARAALDAAWGSWRFASERLHARGLPLFRLVRVNVSTWKSTFGLAGIREEYAKDYAVRAVRTRMKINVGEKHNAGEALLIGTWGARAAVVGAKLPVRIMRARGLYREAA